MNQELNNLLTQYAVAKRDPDCRYDEDDHLVLGQLASSIADMYEDIHKNNPDDTRAQNFASCWRDISERHLLHVMLDPEVRERMKRTRQNVSLFLSL